MVLNKCLEEENPAEKFCEEKEIKILYRIPFDQELGLLNSNAEIAVRKSENTARYLLPCSISSYRKSTMKQVLILSGKGGTGKTTVASAFIKLSNAKAYADCDVDAPNLHLISDWQIEPKRSDYFGLDKAQIDSQLCVQCDACRQNCRFDAIIAGESYQVNPPYACEGCGVCAYVCPPAQAIKMVPSVDGDLMLYADAEKKPSRPRNSKWAAERLACSSPR